MRDPLELHEELMLRAVQQCGPNPTKEKIEAVYQRLKAERPKDERDAIDEAVRQLSSNDGPGFHENGPH